MLKLFLILVALSLNVSAYAQDLEQGLYSYPTAKGIKVGAVFGVLPRVSTDDVLLSASSSVCDHVEIHTMTETDDGILRMRKTSSLSLQKNIDNRLEPMGYHLMLMDLKSALEEGQTFSLTLTFKNLGKKTLNIPVIRRGKAGI